MADSAMVSAGAVRQAADQREVLRAAVIAGPAGFGVLDKRLTGGLWPMLADAATVERARVAAGHVVARQRVLTGAVTVMIVLGLCLFRRESTAVVTGFTTPSKGRFPQARMVALVACGTRWVIAARIGSSGTSEQVLADDLISELRPGTINLADRGFFSMDRWVRPAGTGAQLL